MSSRLTVLLLVAAALALADYNEVWHTDDPVGMTDALYVIGIANTDADPQLELVYRGTLPDFENIYYIWALDLSTGEVEPVTDEFYRIIVEPDREPRLVDIDGDGRSEVLFLAEEGPCDGVCWYLYSHSASGVGSGPGYQRLPVPGLAPAQPNPLRRHTDIDYSLPAAADVRLKVFDASGRLIKDLSPGEQPAGNHRTRWQADDDAGTEVPAGGYFYVLEADGKTLTRSALKLD